MVAGSSESVASSTLAGLVQKIEEILGNGRSTGLSLDGSISVMDRKLLELEGEENSLLRRYEKASIRQVKSMVRLLSCALRLSSDPTMELGLLLPSFLVPRFTFLNFLSDSPR